MTVRLRWKGHSLDVCIILPSDYTWLLIFKGVSGPYIDCNSIVISLGGQISRMAMSKQHQKGELVMGLSLIGKHPKIYVHIQLFVEIHVQTTQKMASTKQNQG